MKKLSHYDKEGRARMVDVSEKPETRRSATAHAFVRIRPSVLKMLPHNPKGDPLEVARIAGIAAAKRTWELIPMCHPLMLTHVDVTAKVEARGVRITATSATTAQTGVEMEALTAAAVAALTVYDMTKALDKGIEIQDLYLIEKTGGKSGDFRRESGAGLRPAKSGADKQSGAGLRPAKFEPAKQSGAGLRPAKFEAAKR
jgi:cyclic pyranopterin phosphate synthase